MHYATSVNKATNIVGVKVIDTDDKQLGKIIDILIDQKSGQVTNVIIKESHFFGLIGEQCNLPWASIYYEPSKQCYIANVNKENYPKAANLDETIIDESSDKAWPHAVSNYLSAFVL